MNNYVRIAAVACIFLIIGSYAAGAATTRLVPTIIKTDPLPLEAGTDGEIFLKIRNTGDIPAEDVTVTIPDTYPFRIKPDTRRSFDVGRVDPGIEYFFTLDVLVADDAPDGANDLRVRIDRSGSTITRTLQVTVQSTDVNLGLANLKTEPTTLRPDTEDNTITVDVINTGDDEAKNVVLELSLPEELEPASSLSTISYLGGLDGGESASATFTLDIAAAAQKGVMTVPATLTYRKGDASTAVSEDASFDLFIDGRPQYELTADETVLQPGKEGELRITVRNVGTETSESTRIRVLDSGDLPFSYASSNAFVGTLEPGAEGTAVLQVTPDADAAAKDYRIDLEVRGVTDTEVFVEDETVPVRIAQVTRNQGLPTGALPAGLVLVLVVAGMGTWWYRRRE